MLLDLAVEKGKEENEKQGCDHHGEFFPAVRQKKDVDEQADIDADVEQQEQITHKIHKSVLPEAVLENKKVGGVRIHHHSLQVFDRTQYIVAEEMPGAELSDEFIIHLFYIFLRCEIVVRHRCSGIKVFFLFQQNGLMGFQHLQKFFAAEVGNNIRRKTGDYVLGINLCRVTFHCCGVQRLGIGIETSSVLAPAFGKGKKSFEFRLHAVERLGMERFFERNEFTGGCIIADGPGTDHEKRHHGDQRHFFCQREDFFSGLQVIFIKK